MTYKELAEAINELAPEQKEMDVTIYIRGIDEFYPAQTFGTSPADNPDILDSFHPYLLV